MKLGRTYDNQDCQEAIMVVAFCYEERQMKIEYEKKGYQAGNTLEKGKGKEISTPESSRHRGDRKDSYDMRQKKLRFSNTSKSKEKDKPMRTYHNKEDRLHGLLALVMKTFRETKLCLRCSKSNHW
jgi:hypothetical protein